MKKTTLYLSIIGGTVLVVICVLVWFIAGPSGPIVVSKQTTHLTEPLRSNGLVDYEQALVEMQGKGVTPEENAAIPYLQATWPAGLAPEDQPIVCDAVQMPMPESFGMSSIYGDASQERIVTWLNQQFAAEIKAGTIEPFANENALDVITQAYSHPWTREQLPPLADWLDEQAPHLAKLHEMNDRPKYFLPSPSLLQPKQGLLLMLSLDTVQSQRDAQRVLIARAKLRIGENQPREAWDDIKTAFTLSDRHNRPGMIVELLVSIALREVACSALAELLDSGQCDSQLLDEIDDYLAKLPPMNDMARALDTTERYMGLDAAIMISTDAGAASELINDDGAMASLAKVPFDRNIMLIRINELYDRMTAALAIEDLEERKKATDQVQQDLETMAENFKTPGNLAGAIFSQKARGEAISQLLCALLMPAVMLVGTPEERVNVRVQLLRVAVELEKWKLQSGDYPESLDELADSVNRALLKDPYAAAQLRYERRAPGYLLYTLFIDRVDDGGTSAYGDIVGGEWLSEDGPASYPDGDLVLRFPLPKKSILELLEKFNADLADENQ
ncbi:hypothetical protein LOC68_16920 [Blastopirellula sp. JC732]|uniref:DUF1559 domain-containing protein n=1 Tax=Blastopirellula sediminis TaxID=2894196 RepID=A0A9X1MPJ5_9BACT|nr:hypothetical protein [Blastopirellula sediminis]MCC9606626.1 hypothetical protein [Blastopirellula sediminis]MCC9630077.1 hypothetical protein [Blastopirellula sediminis]